MVTLLDAIGPAVWRASWQAGLLAVCVTVLLRILGERVTPRWRYLLWSVVLVRFLFVITPASPWSVFNVARFGTGEGAAAVVEQEPPPDRIHRETPVSEIRVQESAISDQPSAVSDQVEETVVVGLDQEPSATPRTVTSVAAVAPTDRVTEPPVARRVSTGQILASCWLAGCLVFIVRLIVAGIGLCRRLRACRPVTDGRVLELLEAACEESGVRRAPVLLVTPEPVSPCLVGTWRPRIIVPESLITGGSSLPLRQVLAHELAHVARRDQWTNWLLLITGTLHWFNPLAWWTLRELRAEREAACDDMALNASQAEDRKSYAETILGFVSRRSPSPIAPGMIGLFSSKQSVARRMERVLQTPAVAPLGPVIVAGLLLGIALVGLTDAMPADGESPSAVAEPAQEEPESGPSGDLRPAMGEYVIPGRVTDMDQTPLAGVRLRLFAVYGPVDSPMEIAETFADDDGRFQFTGLVPPRDEMELDRLSYGVVAEAEGRPPAATLEVFRRTHPRNELWLRMETGESAALTGRITNNRGEPVVGAIVSRMQIAGRPVLEVFAAVTDEDGQFAMTDLAPVEPDPERPERFHFRIHHPDYPITSAAAPMVPADVTVTLPTGCTVTGQVLDGETGDPAAGVIVAAEHNRHTGEDRIDVTDVDGLYRIVVTEGDYNVVVKSADHVAVAVTDRDCQTGNTVELPPLSLTSGGFITGQILNAETGEPVVMSDNGGHITVGLYGPAHPAREGIISPTRQAVVDDEGRFRLRAAAGDNFPYLVNIRGRRMAWDTREQEPVVVREGETVTTKVFIDPPKSPEEKMEAARHMLAGLPDDRTERVAQIIEEFHKLSHTVDETEVWCLLMRDLVGIGADAVPQLCAELDETTEQRTLRRLGFALRAIGDRRAVPALIRAIPRTLLPSSSDYGLIVEDAELLRFMQEHDLDGRSGQHFGFGRPVREIFGALSSLTGQKFDDDALYSISLSEDPRRQVLQRRLYVRQARLWRDWWEGNWRELTDDAEYALVNLPTGDEPLPPATEGLSPNAWIQGVASGMILSPASESGRYADHFLDLDTGLQPPWPDGIPKNEASVDLSDLSDWAAENGVDLMCVTHEAPDGTTTYVLCGFDLKVQEISARDLRNLDRLITEGMLPEGRAAGELLLHHDPDSGREVTENAAFLYVTREGNRGVIEVTDRVTRVADLTGMPDPAPAGVGFFTGVRFNLKSIVP